MGGKLNAIRRFLRGEEVPRWFGLSLVLIYLIGLATVANVGIRRARWETSEFFLPASRHAVGLLAERALRTYEADNQQPGGGSQIALRQFSAAVPTEWIRIVIHGHVVASSNAREVGTRRDEAASRSSVADESNARETSTHSPTGNHEVVRVPIRLSRSTNTATKAAVDVDGPIPEQGGRIHEGDGAAIGAEGDRDELVVGYVEAALPTIAPAASGIAHHAAGLSIFLVVLGSLFVVYRCLREQMRGVARIADRLQSNRHRIQDALVSLRIDDAAALDDVSSAWNELVDLTRELMEISRRNDANAELSRVLRSSGGSALAEALHAIPDALIHIRDESRLEYVNSAAARLMGWKLADGIAPPSLGEARSSGVGDRVLSLIRGALNADGHFEPRVDTLEMDDDNGHARSVYRMALIPLRGAQRAGGCLVVIRDVSQQTQAERAREEFVTQVTHELRTPLTNIRAYAETLSSGMFDDPKVITECYNVITKETRRLSRLIEDILSVSQLEVGTINLNVDNVDLRALLTEGIRDVRGLAEEKAIDLRLVLPAKIEPIRGDRDKLAVVVNNLLGNAIKYTPRDGNVVVGCQMSGDEALLTFKDNGIGISPQDQTKVFEKFVRASDPAVQAESGTGIGLFTAREIVRRHGGDIELISEKGKGSTFMVRLPHRQSRASARSTSGEV